MTMTMPGRGRPSRAAVFSAVDDGVRELARVGGLPSPAENAAIWKDIWYEEAHHSTAIEGNTLLLKQVRVLLETGVVTGPARELREFLEVQAYGEAARWVYSQALAATEWRGLAADRFRSAWSDDHEPGLRRLEFGLREAALEVARRRAALEEAGA